MVQGALQVFRVQFIPVQVHENIAPHLIGRRILCEEVVVHPGAFFLIDVLFKLYLDDLGTVEEGRRGLFTLQLIWVAGARPLQLVGSRSATLWAVMHRVRKFHFLMLMLEMSCGRESAAKMQRKDQNNSPSMLLGSLRLHFVHFTLRMCPHGHR